MMTPIVSNNFQEFTPRLSANNVTFSGALSTDNDGRTIASPNCAITSFEWILLSKPEGAADPAMSQSGELGSELTITIPPNQLGSFLLMLRVSDGTTSAPSSLLDAPNSALAVASIKSAVLGLHLMAEGERFHGDRTNENLLLIEAEINSLRDAVLAAGEMPFATSERLGSVKLNEPHYDGQPDESPAVVYTQGDTWRTLTQGADATGLHFHPEYEGGGSGGGDGAGAYHLLRPDLLVNTGDIVWSAQGIGSVVGLSSANSSALVGASFGTSNDGNLYFDVNTNAASTILLTELDPSIGDCMILVDVMVSPVVASALAAQRLDNAEAVGAFWEAMLIVEARDGSVAGYLNSLYDPNLISKPTDCAAVGMSLHDWTPKAMDFGTLPHSNTLNADVAGAPILTNALKQGALTSKAIFGVRRMGQTFRTYLSLDNGAMFPIGATTDINSTSFSKLSVYLSARAQNIGLRIETSSLRVIANLDDYGLSPAFLPAT
jgi:hypothetical protein